MDIQEKEKRISTELASMKRLYSGLSLKKKKLAYRLCEKAAFLKVSIEECQDDINQNGYYEKFQQSKGVEPYDRTRPVVNTFASFTTSYQKYMKQLEDLLPDETVAQEGDGFDDFLRVRDG